MKNSIAWKFTGNKSYLQLFLHKTGAIPLESVSFTQLLTFFFYKCIYHQETLTTGWKIMTVNIPGNISGLWKNFHSASG